MDLTKKDRIWLNTRVIGHNGLELPEDMGPDAVYACPTNAERNAITAGNFRQHIKKTHPEVSSTCEPPKHTIIIEAAIRFSSKEKLNKDLNNVLRYRIITTCGDANVRHGYKCIDPALCIYIGAYLICVISNKSLTEKVPRGNGTLCRVVSLKLKTNAQSYRWKNYYGRKVWSVCAEDVEWIECEHVVKTGTIVKLELRLKELTHKLISSSKKITRRNLTRKTKKTKARLVQQSLTRRFRLLPERLTCKVSVKPHPLATRKEDYACQVTQIPVNNSDATTGHKLQGMSKDTVIITSWPPLNNMIFTNWEYTVLSRARTLNGLFIFQPIDMDKSFKPTDELKQYLRRAKNLQNKVLNRRKQLLDDLRKNMDNK